MPMKKKNVRLAEYYTYVYVGIVCRRKAQFECADTRTRPVEK